MQSLILAAGMGRRLGRFTHDNTKCMVEVGGKPLIHHALESLGREGIDKLILVVGYQGAKLRAFLGSRYGNIDIEYVTNPIYDKTNNIYSLFLAREHLLRDDTLLIESDLIFEPSVIEGVLRDPRPNLAVVDRYQCWMDGTSVTLDDNDIITNFVPKQSFDFAAIDSYFKTVNIYKFSRDFSRTTYVPFLEAYSSALGNNEYYEQVLKVISTLDTHGLQAYRLVGEKWYEIDEPQDRDNAETIFAESSRDQLKRVAKRHGGYWRYPRLTDFCYLVNPFFPSRKLEDELKARVHDLLSHYPSGMDVQKLLASQLFDVEKDSVVVGNGAAELIRALPQVLDGKVGIAHPAFHEYAASFGNGRVVPFTPANDSHDYSTGDLAKLAESCDNVLLINPDNPSGHYIERTDIVELAGRLQEAGKHLIVDESFVDFCDRPHSQTLIHAGLLDTYRNLIVIRSLGKSHGVPGIRLGILASGNREIVGGITRQLPIWNINSFGEYFLQIIGKYQDEYAAACSRVATEREWLFKRLRDIDLLRVLPSQANFFMCEVLCGCSATELTQSLLHNHNILIKDLTGKHGLEGRNYVRIAVRDRQDNIALLSGLKNVEKELRGAASPPFHHVWHQESAKTAGIAL